MKRDVRRHFNENVCWAFSHNPIHQQRRRLNTRLRPRLPEARPLLRCNRQALRGTTGGAAGKKVLIVVCDGGDNAAREAFPEYEAGRAIERRHL